jgi:hypothetical protein
MKIVGCDLHTRYQQVAMLEQETGELIERRLEHESRVPHPSGFLALGWDSTTLAFGSESGNSGTDGNVASN